MTNAKKGFALFLVLAVIMVAAIIGGIIINITLSHFELTRHKVQRIKAYYNAMAGMNLALELIRTGNWTTGSYTLCQSNCTINDPDLPFYANISITNKTADGFNKTVNVTVNYTAS